MSATQTVTISGDTSIRDIPTERVDDKLASIREVGYGTRRGSTGVGNVGGGLEGKQHIACLRVCRIKFPVSLTEEHHITGNQHARLRRLRQANLPNNFARAGVGGSVQAKGFRTGNMIEKRRAQMQVSVDRLGDKAGIARVSLEDIRVVPGAVVDKFGSRAKSCRVPFTSPVVTRHNQPQRLIGRSVLRRPGNFGLAWSEERAKSSGYSSRVGLFLSRELIEAERGHRLDSRIGLGWCGNLERGTSNTWWDGSLGHWENGLAGAAVENVVLPSLAAMAECPEMLSIFVEREQDGGLRAVVIPNVVVHFLEMPHRVAGKQVYSNDRCRE